MAKPRMPRPGFLLFGTAALLSVTWLGFYAGSLVDGRWQTWLVRAIVWAIGSVVAFLVLSLLRAFQGKGEKSEPDRIEDQLDQARRALASAGLRKQSRLPAILILGPRGSAKTTFVLRSSLDAEHLAGNLYFDGRGASTDPRGSEPVAPTEALNVWYHQGCLVVEVAGQIVVDPSRWGRLVRSLRPGRWIPALLGRHQAPRVAVVCCSMEDLSRHGDSETSLAVAKTLRERLCETSERFGIRLPVYVVFTKADTIPHFTEFAENLTDAEIHEVLGATLHAAGETLSGSFQERESSRISAAIDTLYHSLAEHRLEVLPRAGSPEKAGSAYEFPREFRKVSSLVTNFLVELCRPSQLGASPFLRGFYFTGVRPLELAADGPVVPMTSVGNDAPAGATRVFRADQLRVEQPPSGGEVRRIPQWVFAQRVLRQVVLQDDVAMGLTTAGFGLDALRRAALTLALVAVLGVGLAAVVGHARDRRLVADTEDAIAGVLPVESPDPSLAGLDDLRRLDRLREVTARLSGWEHGRKPPRRLLGLYSGDDLYPLARQAYFNGFEKLLLGRTRATISATLSDLPENPSLDERDRVYNALKAHIEMNVAPDSADSSFFEAVLTDFWSGLSLPSDSVMALARSQFAFYAAELPWGSPFPPTPNELHINSARAFLAANTSEDSFYQGLLSQANRHPSFALNRDILETEPFIVDTYEVPGAFTSAGWAEVTGVLDDVERFFLRDMHVVGPEFYGGFDRSAADALTATLRARYEADYARAWNQLLLSATVVRHSLAQAEDRLNQYGQPQSALFRMLAVVDENTRGKSAALDSAFAAVQLLTGPDTIAQQFSADLGAPYLERIRAMALAAGEFNRAPGDQGAQEGLRTAASNGIQFVGNVQASLPSTPELAGAVSGALTQILRSPFDWGRASVERGTSIAANNLAAEFCSQQARVLGLFPFAIGGSREARWEDVHAFFGPDQGSAAAFFDRVDALGPMNAAYQTFKARVERIRSTLYSLPESASPGFRVQVSFDASDPVMLNVDGRTATFSQTQRQAASIVWDAPRAAYVSLIVQGPSSPPPLRFDGPWALFRLFHLAEWQNAGPNQARVTWSSLGLSGQVRYTSEPVLDRGYFGDFRCPTSIAR